MRSLAIVFGFCILAITLNAQSTVPRVPIYEVFSGSSCPPCKPANEHLVPLFEANKGDVVVVKYQMNWPGNGDPYYTQEAGYRRGFFGVNSIPKFYVNGSETEIYTFDQTAIDATLNEEARMEMKLEYYLVGQTVHISGYAKALDDFEIGGQRLMIMITEKVTYNNATTNGETEFHNVLKKVLPESEGELMIGEIKKDSVINIDLTYTFEGQYDPNTTAANPIDHSTAHTVEDFDNLHVVMFIQGLGISPGEKLIYQAVNGEKVWPLSVNEVELNNEAIVYPNPVNDEATISLALSGDDAASIQVYDVTGKLAYSKALGNLPKGVHNINFNTSSLGEGLYILHVKQGDGLVAKKFSVVR